MPLQYAEILNNTRRRKVQFCHSKLINFLLLILFSQNFNKNNRKQKNPCIKRNIYSFFRMGFVCVKPDFRVLFIPDSAFETLNHK